VSVNIRCKPPVRNLILTVIVLWTVSAAVADPRLWGPQGLTVRCGSNRSWSRTAAQDSAGNTLYVWSDERTGNPDVYAQLVSPAGVPLWTENGLTVVQQGAEQVSPVACATGGGWVIAWIDYRRNRNYSEMMGYLYGGDIYAEKLNYAGYRLWSHGDSTGVEMDHNPTTEPMYAHVALNSDGAGGAMLTWQDLRRGSSYATYAQHIRAEGYAEWSPPLSVSDNTGDQFGLDTAPADSGSIFLAWIGCHSDGHGFSYNASKVTPTGEIPWCQSGALVCDTTTNMFAVRVCGDGFGGCYVAWNDDTTGKEHMLGDDIWAQRLDRNGQPLWARDRVVVCNAPADQFLGKIATSRNGGSADGLLVAWADRRDDQNILVYAQKILPSGSVGWSANGVALSIYSSDYDFGDYPSLISDRAGGLISIWTDDRRGNYRNVAVASRLNASGVYVWGTNGVLIADTTRAEQSWPVPAMTGNACMVAFEHRVDTLSSLRVQTLDLLSGQRLLSPVGTAIQSGLDGYIGSMVCASLSSGKIGMVWEDPRGGLYYQMVDSAGGTVLPVNGSRLLPDCPPSGPCDQGDPSICADVNGGFFVVFLDGNYRVRVCHVNAEGVRTSDPAGNLVYEWPTTVEQLEHGCTADGQGGVYVVWIEVVSNAGSHISLMHMSAACQPQWTEPLILADTRTAPYEFNTLLTDSAGNCLIGWGTGADTIRICAAQVSASREIRWTTTLTGPGSASSWPAKMISDGHNGAYVAWCWQGGPGYVDSVLVQHLDMQGDELWPHGGVPLAADTLEARGLTMALNNDGDLLCVWQNGVREDFNSGGDTYG